MQILVSSDNNYVQHLGVMLTSLLSNCSLSHNIVITVINDSIDNINQEKLESICCRFNANFKFLNSDTFNALKYKPKNNSSLSAFNRLYVDEIYDKSINEVLYLDCDLVVRNDISEIFKTNLSNHTIAAVRNDGIHYQKILGMPHDQVFFNSGVMLINLERWRQKKIAQQAIQFLEENFETMKRNDQDVLNALLFDDWFELKPTWNAHLYFYTSPQFSLCKPEELKEVKNDPAIVHFTTNNKPWLYMSEHPYKNEYYNYLEKTEWASFIPKDKTVYNFFVKYGRRLNRKLLFWNKVLKNKCQKISRAIAEKFIGFKK